MDQNGKNEDVGSDPKSTLSLQNLMNKNGESSLINNQKDQTSNTRNDHIIDLILEMGNMPLKDMLHPQYRNDLLENGITAAEYWENNYSFALEYYDGRYKKNRNKSRRKQDSTTDGRKSAPIRTSYS